MAWPVFTYLKKLLASCLAGQDAAHPYVPAGNRAPLESLVRLGRVPGLAIAVVRNGVPVLQEGFGYADLADKQAVDPQRTYFRAASVSKPIAATALLRLVQEGRISLDASFYDYVPYFPKKAHDFTIRQLAGHTAGIRGYRGKEYALNKPLGIRESLQLFQDDALLFKPGSGYHYNSYDWVLLSLAMQEVTGMPFAEYVSKSVLLPLGMNRTRPEVPGEELPGKATFYTRHRGRFQKASMVNNEYKLAGGGFLSTAGDIVRLGQAYLDGRIGSPPLVSEFLQSQKVNGNPTWYGLGWEVSRDEDHREYYGHTGNSVGAFSMLRVYPEFGAVIALLVNCSNPGIASETRQFLNNILPSGKSTAASPG